MTRTELSDQSGDRAVRDVSDLLSYMVTLLSDQSS